ncbi:hypothetical protein [Novipirellula caenicola]|uniref:DNA binding HTH domain-containing protein n=1 Tax=Novipirellula caenicola TaxID=1536901 RepID=A0ABP9VIA4_9BACT
MDFLVRQWWIRRTRKSIVRLKQQALECFGRYAIESDEHSYLSVLIEKHAGNIPSVAHQAGLSRQAMPKWFKKHGVVAADYRK